MGPHMIVADDDRMEVDGPAAAAPPLHEDMEDEKLETVSDDDGEVIFDAVGTFNVILDTRLSSQHNAKSTWRWY